MSDGPHRSLRMRRHWQKLAERAAKSVFSLSEVNEALPYALHCDILEAPIEAVCDIVAGGAQGSFFNDDRLAELEIVGKSYYGSAAAVTLIECAAQTVHQGLTGEAAKEYMLKNTLDGLVRNSFRSMEEHYQRKEGGESSSFLRKRLDAARNALDTEALTKKILSPQKRARTRLNKQTGIDEGPAI
jgi:hypothetical protein